MVCAAETFYCVAFPLTSAWRGPEGPRSAVGAGLSGAESGSKVWCGVSGSYSYLLARSFLPSSLISGSSPNVSCSLLVYAKNRNSACSDFGDVRIFVMSMFLPPMLFRSVCLAPWCAGQCSRRCCTISSLCWHAGQVGESIFPRRNRCLAKGACPVLSCARMLASFLGSFVTRSMYLWEGVVGSVFITLLHRFESLQPFCARRSGFSLCIYPIADLLYGRVVLRDFGSLCVSLLPSLVAFFASSSACSLPPTPLCPGTHLTVIFMP